MRSTSHRAARRAREAWDSAIDVWEDFQESGLDYARDAVHGPALLRALGSVRGQKVLDLGCGQGRFTRVVAGAGARVSAVDWSAAMIRSARRHEAEDPMGIDFRLADAAAVDRLWAPGTFDVVMGCMSFMDMPDLPRILRAAHRLLKPDGRLVFSVSHPFYTSEVDEEPAQEHKKAGLQIDHYFEQRTRVTEWRMRRLQRPFETPYWHRTLEGWFQLLGRTGFEIEELTEPRATVAQVRARPRLKETRRIPFFLVVGCRKRPVGAD
jgi:2-polyprenyl-3-methyl-5-hydroxy-6-metoxy-1,4-benzoquinol methylase